MHKTNIILYYNIILFKNTRLILKPFFGRCVLIVLRNYNNNNNIRHTSDYSVSNCSTARQIVIIRNKLSARNPSLYYIILLRAAAGHRIPFKRKSSKHRFRPCTQVYTYILYYYIISHRGVVNRTRSEINRLFRKNKKQIDRANNNCPAGRRLIRRYFTIMSMHMCVCVTQ